MNICCDKSEFELFIGLTKYFLQGSCNNFFFQLTDWIKFVICPKLLLLLLSKPTSSYSDLYLLYVIWSLKSRILFFVKLISCSNKHCMRCSKYFIMIKTNDLDQLENIKPSTKFFFLKIFCCLWTHRRRGHF